MSLKTVLNALGDAIRGKAGVTGALTLQQMTDAVSGISVGVDTSDATAGAGDILSGKTAYAGGERVTGAIPSQAAQTITPSTEDQTIAAEQYLSGAQTVLGDANLLPENIAQGVSIFGVEGTLAGGGLTQYATGSYKGPSGANMTGFTITGLSFKPSIVVYASTSSTYKCVGFGTPNASRATQGSSVYNLSFTANDDGFVVKNSSYAVVLDGCTVKWHAFA